MNVDEQILQIVSDPSFDSFTAFELKKAFVEKVGEEHFGVVEMIHFVCAQMKLLAKNGVIERSRKEHIFSSIYVKKAHFHVVKSTLLKSPRVELKEKHISYKQQLLLGIGEAEEYKKLCVEYPDLQVKLQAKYNSVRDQNTKILGKIKVIESLLNNKST
jgi:hypothetical protein